MSNELNTKSMPDTLLDDYYDKLLSPDTDERAVAEYKENLRLIEEQFLEKTRIHAADLPFLFLGVALQCVRIFLINKLTKIEKANEKGGREDQLHEAQDRILKKFDNKDTPKAEDLHTSLGAIISLRGVPYDAQAPLTEEIKKLKLFKGANHRFSTLGHEPLLGLVFGPANILTGTITMSSFQTYYVRYDVLLKNPRVSDPVDTLKMLTAALKRFDGNLKSVVAAVIKHLIHIKTDLYTPAGIQLPGVGLLLDNSSVEKLTEYVSMGDVLKAGAAAGASIAINAIVGVIHGSKLLFESDAPVDTELCRARTKKVVMYSNIIASSSNIVASAIAKDIKMMDWGGLLVTLYRIISDTRFISKLEKEFIDSETSALYEQKLKDLEEGTYGIII